VVGIDLGTRRIGVAVSDSSGVIASPHSVVQRSGGHQADHRAIAAVVEEYEAELVVVGLPLSMDGSHGPAARAALDEVDELARALPVPVRTVDERLTTVSAERSLQLGGVRGSARRSVVDKVAAAILLQTWLDGPARRTWADEGGGHHG
jgi:putative Holliday junction resolvase